jgi:hypothetical protein
MKCWPVLKNYCIKDGQLQILKQVFHGDGIRLGVIKETKIMNDNQQDPNLQAPQEANTTKHINFLEVEEGGDGSSDNNADTNNDESPTKKAWDELRNDNKNKQDSEG